MSGIIKENQLGVLAQEGRLREIPGYDPGVSRERVERAQPFLEQLAPPGALAKGGVEDKIRHDRVLSVWRQLARIGVQPLTVVNIMPWRLDVTCGVFPHFVPAARWDKGEEFGAHSFGIKDIRIDQCDMGDGKYSPQGLLPVDIAEEFLKKYVGTEGEGEEDDAGQRVNNKPGGLFIFVGTIDNPPANFPDLMAEAHVRLEHYFWAQYKSGIAAWERYKHDPMQITARYIDGAKYLHRKGLIDILPEWAAMKKGDAGIKSCPNCAESIKKAALQCRYCGAVINADGTFSRPGEAQRPKSPDPEPQPPTPQRQVAAPQAEPEMSDKEILDAPEDQLPPVRPARKSKNQS